MSIYNHFEIVEVDPDWALDQESMGTKAKFWYRKTEDGIDSEWLFKYPRPNTGEHWAEKIAAEVAEALSIPHARVELAVFEGERGTATESFARDRRGLFHGNQLLGLTVLGYDLEKKYRQSYHTLQNILNVFQSIVFAVSEGPSEEEYRAENAEAQFAEYLILDAVIGNTDRHHENWGMLREWTGDDWQIRLAPSFDHASSLGRELTVERREALITEGRIWSYIGRASGGIYVSEEESRGPGPLQLVRIACKDYPGLFLPGLAKLSTLGVDNILNIVGQVPDDWMTTLQREFAAAVIEENLQQLKELI